MEMTLFWLQEKVIVFELFENSMNLVLVFLESSVCRDEDIIHVNDYISRDNFFSEDRIHHRLERGWGIGESEEHYCWFKESLVGFERGFPLISVLDTNVVVSPSNIKFGEPSFAYKALDEFLDEGEWVGVVDGEFIEFSVILYGSPVSICLFDPKEWRCVRRLGDTDVSLFELVVNPFV
jgi:hypothetical protein